MNYQETNVSTPSDKDECSLIGYYFYVHFIQLFRFLHIIGFQKFGFERSWLKKEKKHFLRKKDIYCCFHTRSSFLKSKITKTMNS